MCTGGVAICFIFFTQGANAIVFLNGTYNVPQDIRSVFGRLLPRAERYAIWTWGGAAQEFNGLN